MRELISNASDALEKLRYMELTNQQIVEPEKPLEIRIVTDEANNTLTITDAGIGMNDQELVENLGTIARSGSKQFLKKVQADTGNTSAGTETNIIGQFGVGFYSAFMVADKVEVYTRSYKDGAAFHWVSDGCVFRSSISRGHMTFFHVAILGSGSMICTSNTAPAITK